MVHHHTFQRSCDACGLHVLRMAVEVEELRERSRLAAAEVEELRGVEELECSHLD